MSQLVNTVVTNILTALYEPFWFAITMSVLFMFLYMYAYCTAETGKGIKRALAAWLKEFKRSVFFRRLLALTFYTSLVLFLVSVYDLTLTLPGIAGIILGIGMAVDGNVIIYTRIREEIGD